MVTYVVTGVSRGIGVSSHITSNGMVHTSHPKLTINYPQQYEILRQLSADPESTVIGLVRNKSATDKKLSEDTDLNGRSNIHILEADVTNYDALKVRVQFLWNRQSKMLTELIRKRPPTPPRLPAGALTTSLPTQVSWHSLMPTSPLDFCKLLPPLYYERARRLTRQIKTGVTSLKSSTRP